MVESFKYGLQSAVWFVQQH